jgi:hypothetical protein
MTTAAEVAVQFERLMTSINSESVANFAFSVHVAVFAVMLVSALVNRTPRSALLRIVRVIWFCVALTLACRASYLVMKRFEFFLQTRVALGFNVDDAELLRRSVLFYHIHLALFVLGRLIAMVRGVWASRLAFLVFAASVGSTVFSMYLFTEVVETTMREPSYFAPLAVFVFMLTMESLKKSTSTTTSTTKSTTMKKNQ